MYEHASQARPLRARVFSLILSAPKGRGDLHRHITSLPQTPGGTELSDNVLAGSQPLYRLMWYCVSTHNPHIDSFTRSYCASFSLAVS